MALLPERVVAVPPPRDAFDLVLQWLQPPTPIDGLVNLSLAPAYQGLPEGGYDHYQTVARMRAARRNPGPYDRELQGHLNRAAFQHAALHWYAWMQEARRYGRNIAPHPQIGETQDDMPGVEEDDEEEESDAEADAFPDTRPLIDNAWRVANREEWQRLWDATPAECPVCFMAADHPAMIWAGPMDADIPTRCTHWLCVECWREISQRDMRCPLCRDDVSQYLARYLDSSDEEVEGEELG